MKGVWVPHDIRDAIVDFIKYWSARTELPLLWLGLASSKYYDWRSRYGKVNEHNGLIPRDFWLEDWEKEAIIQFHEKNPPEGYRRHIVVFLFMFASTCWVCF